MKAKGGRAVGRPRKVRDEVVAAGGSMPMRVKKAPAGKRVPATGVSNDQMKAMALEKIARWKRAWPSTWSIPNVAQARLFEYLRRRPYPKDLIFLAGNGVGKSHGACLIMSGIIWGPDAVPMAGMHPDFAGMRDFEAWSSFRKQAKEENRPIFGRIIAASDSLKGNGPMIQRIRRLFPKGLWIGEKNGAKYISEIYCWDRSEDVGDKDLAVAIIDIKTHQQDKGQHAGADLDFIILDEPVAQDIYEECIGRTRANPDAVRIFTITPLEMCGWLINALVENADGQKVAVVYGSTWDNCTDWHPDPAMWSSGVVGEGRVLTRGQKLNKSSIDDMIDKWTRMSPDTVDARVWGKATHLSGAVYKGWNPTVHMVEEIQEDWKDWPVWCIIDPHHARPPAVIWIAQGPHTSYVVAEYPDHDYTKITGAITVDGRKREWIEDHADVIVEWEKRMGFVDEESGVDRCGEYRWGDPNSLKFIYATSSGQSGEGQNLQGLLYNRGLWFNLANDNIRLGHEALSGLLHYNRDQEIRFPNVPRLRCLKTNYATGEPMVNFPNAMARYGFKKKALAANTQPMGNIKAVMDETYKDFADVGRYFAVSSQDEPFQPVSASRGLADIIRESRERKTVRKDAEMFTF